MDVIKILGVIFLLAFLIESLVEYVFGTIADQVAVLTPWKWVAKYIAMVVGIVAAFIYRFDLLSLLGTYIGTAVPLTELGIILTGAAIGRGSNYLHDIVKQFFPASEPQG